jgi:hypothetical protein
MVEEQPALFVEAHLWSTLAHHLMLLPRQAQKTWMLIYVLEILIYYKIHNYETIQYHTNSKARGTPFIICSVEKLMLNHFA